MRSLRHLEPGSAAELSIDLPGEERLKLPAEVVRIERSPRAGMGLRFVGESDRHRRPLANFIMRQHAVAG